MKTRGWWEIISEALRFWVWGRRKTLTILGLEDRRDRRRRRRRLRVWKSSLSSSSCSYGEGEEKGRIHGNVWPQNARLLRRR
ncbi:hypothetical protein CIPAW_14G131100 [Carya illinoinensis]|uniref:Uncharacterized protein n=1 Tax=Carya illinoinensis TaxID=32201 RepID=A0A8T1NEN1_CARIL|nr:hypothetical protein CIPAW_14G131100 [Carya illinoinensis]KAG6630089.1 hypothetical protein CIPAW_14G131100 [Carya illinoinensis]